MHSIPVAIVFTLLLCSVPNGRAADWPQWRGPLRDGHSQESFPALSSLPNPEQALWKRSIGGGFSSPIVSGGKLVYLDEQGDSEVAHCLDTVTGKMIWEKPYAEKFKDEWGAGPRATPIIDEGRVYVQSCNGTFKCLSLKNGAEIWAISFEKDFGVKFLGNRAREGTASRRGNNGSAVIDGDSIVVPVGNKDGATLVCFDKKTGAVKWKAGHEEAAYSSLVAGTLAGRKQVIGFMADSVMGVDLQTGEVLWRVPLRTNAKRHAATPVLSGDNVIVNSHTFGLLSLHISREGERFHAREQWRNAELKINLATPVLIGKTLYSQGTSGKLVAVEAATGKELWSQDGFGKENTALIKVGDKLLAFTDFGQLTLLKASPLKYSEIATVQIAGKNWNYPAVADGWIFIRDQRELACYPLAK
ncbi:MAG: PQQ-binding-like beta-propeller repeat protein [Verrucomicrobiales bacterium]